MVTSQREDLVEKDGVIEDLEEDIESLTTQLEKKNEVSSLNFSGDEEELILIKARKLIVKLTEENERFQENDKNAKALIEELTEKNEKFQKKIENLETNIEEIKSGAPQKIDKEDLELANKKIQALISEIEDFQAQVIYLHQELDKAKQSSGAEQSDLSNKEIENLKAEIQDMRELIIFQEQELEKNKKKLEGVIEKVDLDEVIEKEGITDLESAKQKIQSLHIENEELQDLVVFLQQQINEETQVPKETIEDHERLEDVDMDLSKIAEENATLKRKLNTANITIDNLVNEIDGYTKEISEQGEDIRKKNSKISVLNTKLDGLKEQNLDLKQKIVDSDSEEKNTEEAKLDEWYDNQSAETIEKLKEENQKLKNLVYDLRASKEEQIPIFEEEIDLENLDLDFETLELGENAEDIKALKEDYEKLVKESQELIEENQRLSDVILELKDSKAEAPIVVGYNPEMEQPYDDQSAELIANLKKENQDLLDQMLDLNLKLQESQKAHDISAEQVIEQEKIETNELTDKIRLLEEKNQKLNKIISELKESKEKTSFKLEPAQYVQIALPKSYQSNIISALLNQTANSNKEEIIQLLLTDLYSENREIKKFAITILSGFKDDKIYNELIKFAHDKDWIIRYTIVKAIGKFDNENKKEILNELVEDPDIDVREAAEKELKRMNIIPENLIIREDFTPERWNWSEREKKWVYVEISGGKTKYHYQTEPPDEFITISYELKRINNLIMESKDLEEKMKLFQQLMKLSRKMDSMRRGKL